MPPSHLPVFTVSLPSGATLTLPQDPVDAPVVGGGGATAGPAPEGGGTVLQDDSNKGGIKPKATDDSCLTTQLPMILLFVGIFYFMLFRPQQKAAKQAQQLQSSLQKGDRVVTDSGIHGVVDSVQESTVTLLVDGQLRMVIDRPKIGRKVPNDSETAPAKEE